MGRLESELAIKVQTEAGDVTSGVAHVVVNPNLTCRQAMSWGAADLRIEWDLRHGSSA